MTNEAIIPPGGGKFTGGSQGTFENKVVAPSMGKKMRYETGGKLWVPDNPIIPFIEGDGIGVDVTPAMMKVVDAAVEKAYKSKRKIAWMEIYAGEKAKKIYQKNIYGNDTWLPAETISLIREHIVAIKGPLTTPVGGGIRSLNVSLRQELDLYICLRPVRYFDGVPSPLKNPELTDMVIFRENSEDIYTGIEWKAGSAEAEKLMKFLCCEMEVAESKFLCKQGTAHDFSKKCWFGMKFCSFFCSLFCKKGAVHNLLCRALIKKNYVHNFNKECGLGVKFCTKEGTQRLVEAAIQYAIDHDRQSVTLVHKGNIMKFTEGAFKNWGYQLVCEEFGASPLEGGDWMKIQNPKNGKDIIIKDVIADALLQQILLSPEKYDVIACMNLNGDYISDALAAQVGGIGIAPGANIGDKCALFEATHGTAPKYAGKNKANPGSIILSAEMMLRHIDWNEAADLMIKGITNAIKNKTITYDFARFTQDAEERKCSEFADDIIENM